MTKARARKAHSDSSTIYELKVILSGSRPSIWRRIQVVDCTLDELHQSIQTAMGWTNSHLHEFEIGKARYTDPALADDPFDAGTCKDSRVTMLSDVLGQRDQGLLYFFGKRHRQFRFLYTYDFGDGWNHEIRVERVLEREAAISYPRCIAGARACPPEDVGGVGGYAHLLRVLANPRHAEYEELHEWAGDIDPDHFSPEEKSEDMQTGLPDW